MEDFDFFFNGGIVNRGILQAVPQGFVVERDFSRGGKDEIARRIPIVDQAIFFHRVRASIQCAC